VSKDFRHGIKQNTKAGFKRAKREDVAPRDFKGPSKQQREQQLRHAVNHQDLEAFEDYDENDV
jgi:hypothetical protein